MKTLVTRLVVTMIVATFVFVPARVGAQEKTASKPRVDFRFNADQPTSLPAPRLAAARPTAARALAVPRRKMSAGKRIAIGAAIGLGLGITYFAARGCAGAEGSNQQAYNNQCVWPFWGIVAGGGLLGYAAGR